MSQLYVNHFQYNLYHRYMLLSAAIKAACYMYVHIICMYMYIYVTLITSMCTYITNPYGQYACIILEIEVCTSLYVH